MLRISNGAMTMTSDERREVAERLREYGNDTLKDGSLLKTLKDVTGADSWRYVLLALADLIDPTCHDFGGEEGTNGEGYDFACSACGYVCDLAEPRFCPNCGARVVRDDD